MTLAELARRSGWSPSDVAFLAGVEESTVSRLWHAEDWLVPTLLGVLMLPQRPVPLDGNR